MPHKTTPSNSVSSVAAPSTPRNNKETSRARRETDPLRSTRLRAAAPSAAAAHAKTHSIDSASRLAASTTTKSSSLSNIFSVNSSPISSDNFSDPLLASVSPRKPKTATTTTASSHRGRGPNLKLRTPQTARDHGSPSPSTTTNNTTTTASTSATNNTATSNETITTHTFSPSPPNVAPSHSAIPKATTSSSLEPKSPQKRSPASRSSQGIETSTGPPPALSTRQSQTREKSWNTVANQQEISTPPATGRTTAMEPTRHHHHPPPRASFGVEENNNLNNLNHHQHRNNSMKEEYSPKPTTLPTRKERASFPTRSHFQSREREPMSSTLPRFSGSLRTVSDRTEREESGTDTTNKESSGDDTKKNDDVFLNIAKDTSDQPTPSNRAARHRSSGSLHQISRLRQSRSSPSPAQEFDTNRSEVSRQEDYPPVPTRSATVRSPSTAHPLDESSRLRYFGVTPRASGTHTRSRLSRNNAEIASDPPQPPSESRASAQDPSQMHSYRQRSQGGSRGSRALSGTDGTERAKPEAADRSRVDGTESTLSTTAPSTVWDELDDLKSRIRKLEVTGKFPTSSAAAMSSFSGERPRTASTTVTTLSSSPKHARKATTPPAESESTPVTNQIQNLLLSALAKSKPRLSSAVYQSLEAAATDALTLSNILNSNPGQGSGSASLVSGHGTASSERQMRRKADGVCRSLTEVCLALSEGQVPPSSSSSTKPRPGSRDTATAHPRSGSVEPDSATPSYYRRSGSHEPEDLQRRQNSFVSAGGSFRENRRSSMYNLSNGNYYGASDAPDSPSGIDLPTPPARFNRSSLYLRSRRTQGNEQQYDDNEPTTTAVSRPLSRAVTDAAPPSATERFTTRDRIARDNSSPYTPTFDNQPSHEERSPRQYAGGHSRASSSVQSGLPLRRSLASQPTTHIPAASHTSIQPGFRRYASAAMRQSVDHSSTTPKGSDTANSFQDDGRSRQLDPARTTSHRTSLGHLRNRTESLGTRRISIAPRHVSVTANGGGMGHDNID